ncbi:MAG: hypothetical protein HC895_01815 [Leptolyngbyaceae cyanobacterium SM1_3_5]|nr:hypothetical protein [Leptolyngbyaceae cyanobacterium SM1_3_5]
MQFAFTYAPGTTLQQMISFETAGRIWASHLNDKVTVNIHVNLTDTLPPASVGGALLGVQADQEYEDWRSSLAADRTSADDQLIHQNQPATNEKFTALLNGTTQSGETLNISRANAKAIGLRNGQDATLDGYILMTNQLSSLGLEWDYTLSDTAPGNSVDFHSVACTKLVMSSASTAALMRRAGRSIALETTMTMTAVTMTMTMTMMGLIREAHCKTPPDSICCAFRLKL